MLYHWNEDHLEFICSKWKETQVKKEETLTRELLGPISYRDNLKVRRNKDFQNVDLG